MAGHSKWANIKRQKAVVDSKRSKIFTKISRDIIVAARTGLPDPAGNFQLRSAIDKAKAAGIPNENIERAIAKGAGTFGGRGGKGLVGSFLPFITMGACVFGGCGVLGCGAGGSSLHQLSSSCGGGIVLIQLVTVTHTMKKT